MIMMKTGKRISIFLLASLGITFSLASTQCCPPWFSLDPDRVVCVSGTKEELQVDGMDQCQGKKEVVDVRHTSFTYHGSKYLFIESIFDVQ